MTNEERIRELLKNAEKFDGLSFIKERIANREQIRKQKREKLTKKRENQKRRSMKRGIRRGKNKRSLGPIWDKLN